MTGGGALLTGFEHAYDRVGNRKFERRLHDGGRGDNYVYDSLYRLVTFERLVPAASAGAPGLPGASVVKDWKIDGVQNWRELITNGATTTTSVDAVNQYTAFGAAAPDHDLNGNLLTPDVGGAPAVALEYDFLNRLRRVTSADGGSIEHDYDAEGRRVRTRASAVASMPAVSEFVFDGWEEIEEHVKAASGSPFALARRYVNGHSLDEPVRLENLAFYPGAGTYWFQQSTLGNVAAIADSSGAIVERYTYDAYGLPQFETPANVAKAVSASDFGNPYLFHARRFEPALYPLYDFRARFFDPTRGRFVQRDPPGTWHDELNFGGAQAFVANSPVNLADPFGLGVFKLVKIIGRRLRVLADSDCVDDAVRWVDDGHDVLADSRHSAEELSKAAGGTVRKDKPHKDKVRKPRWRGRRPHYHARSNPKSHIFYDIVATSALLSAASIVPGSGSNAVSDTIVMIIDTVNPLTTAADLQEIGEEFDVDLAEEADALIDSAVEAIDNAIDSAKSAYDSAAKAVEEYVDSKVQAAKDALNSLNPANWESVGR